MRWNPKVWVQTKWQQAKDNKAEIWQIVKGLVIQIIIFYAIQELYKFGRSKAIAKQELAFAHAFSVIQFEKSIQLFHEITIQQFTFAHFHWIMKAVNQFYISGYFPPVVIFFVSLLIFRRQYFPFVRDAFYVTNIIAMTLFFTFPCAPPRLLPPELGFVDTLKTISHIDFYTNVKRLYAPNPYAAIPSMHVGYVFVAALVAWKVINLRFSWLFMLYPLAMWYTTIVTGNHYVVDGIAGCLCVISAFTLVELYACYIKKDPKYIPWPGWERKFNRKRLAELSKRPDDREYEELDSVAIEMEERGCGKASDIEAVPGVELVVEDVADAKESRKRAMKPSN